MNEEDVRRAPAQPEAQIQSTWDNGVRLEGILSFRRFIAHELAQDLWLKLIANSTFDDGEDARARRVEIAEAFCAKQLAGIDEGYKTWSCCYSMEFHEEARQVFLTAFSEKFMALNRLPNTVGHA